VTVRMAAVREYSLEIEGPLATCGHCRFISALVGTFSVEDGLLVWRGEADVQPRRGPDLSSCCESSSVVEFASISVDEPTQRRILSDEDLAALRESARAAVEAQMAEWHRDKP
jgi:hypothetical protein